MRANEDAERESYLPNRLVWLALEAVVNAAFSPASPPGYTAAEIARFSRLASLGILVEQRYTGFGGGPGTAGADRHYFVAELGKDLLRFISAGDSAVTA